jgi:hypothetical protein
VTHSIFIFEPSPPSTLLNRHATVFVFNLEHMSLHLSADKLPHLTLLATRG